MITIEEALKLIESKINIDDLIIDAYNQLVSHPDKPVSIEEIVETIDRWGALDGVDYWQEALGLDVRNWSPDADKDFKAACNYVREFSYRGGKDKLGHVEYEKYLNSLSSEKDLDEEVVEESFNSYLSFEKIFWGIYDDEFDLPFEKTVAYINNKYAEKIWADEEDDADLSVLTETEKSDIVEHAKEEAQNWNNLDIFNSHARYKSIPEIKQQIESIFGVVNNKLHEELETEDAIDSLTETYSDDELDDMVGKVYNTQKIANIFRRKKYNDRRLFAHTVCVKCGRDKNVFLSNLVNDPNKYGSCICSDTNIDAKIDNIADLYSGNKKLKSNTSGYTGISFIKTYRGEPYNKWRAYIEVDGVRTYLGDFTSKAKAIKARKEAGENGIKWYKDNRNRLMRDVRRKSKKYKTSKYRETQKSTSYKNKK